MNKENLENLKKRAAARLEAAKTPEEIQDATDEVSNIESLEKDLNETEEANAKLLASYKAALRGQKIPNADPTPNPEGEAGEHGLSAEEALAKVLAMRKKGE